MVGINVDGNASCSLGLNKSVALVVAEGLAIYEQGAVADWGHIGFDFFDVAHVVVIIFEVGQGVMGAAVLDGE